MATKLIPLTEDHQRKLDARGVPPGRAVALGWQTCADRRGDWIAIPFHRRGKVVNHKYRRIVKDLEGHNFEQDKGGEQCFYNLEVLEQIEQLPAEDQRLQAVVITEGELDCAVALECGFNAVSVPGGAPDRAIENEDSVKFDFLKDFPKYVIAILAVDDDPAGQILRSELAIRIGWYRCKWVKFPKGCKDLSDVFRLYGEKGVRMVLTDKASFMNEGGLFKMSDLPAQPETQAYGCGIGNLNDMIKLRRGDVSIYTGIPSMGKTLFVNTLACNMSRLYGWKGCFGSFEQNPRGDHLRSLRTYYIGRPRVDELGNELWSDSDIVAADGWIDQHFTFIVPDVNTDDMITLKWVLTRARAAITQHGADLIIVDPWNELDHDRPNGMSLTEYTGFAIKSFKQLAKKYMVHVAIVAHPAKMEKNKDGGYGVPTLYDISDSSHWANKCDLGVIIHRIEGEGDPKYATLVRVAKVRYWGIIGRTGDKLLEYLPGSGQYIDCPDFQPKRKRESQKAITELEDKKKPNALPKKSIPYKE